MSTFIAEIVGTAVLVLLGNGVVANALLKRTKGEGSGWLVIATAWGTAVFVAVAIVAPISGAHINPAVTLGLAVAGNFAWTDVPAYWTAQMLGAILGATLVWLMYRQHYELTDDKDAKLATFCTAPAISSPLDNFFSEVLGTFILVLAVLKMSAPSMGLGAMDALPVGLVVLIVGLALGGTTGYAINPARDLGPRIAHALLPIPSKRDSDWPYAWIPVLGPLSGGLLAALLANLI
ncbi:MAG: MIP/aquaporin family protein [Acidobacteriota bacterium]|nr:MAG: MIP/aquaporin family protein [Acidobacteriota bacterium]